MRLSTSSTSADLDAFFALRSEGMRLGLANMEAACLAAEHPERSCPVIHVAGTNGKGSTVRFLEAALLAAGWRTGTFTSPHLHRFGERIRVSGCDATETMYRDRLREVLDGRRQGRYPRLSFFEAATLLAFLVFRDEACEVAIIEVGLGGRLDATNVVAPEVAVISSIGLDHCDRLGDTEGQIATEKAGIIKDRIPVVVGRVSDEAFTAISNVAHQRQAPVFRFGRDFGIRGDDSQNTLWFGEEALRVHELGLRGEHQLHNAALAFATLQTLASASLSKAHSTMQAAPSASTLAPKLPTQGQYKQAFASTKLPGRLEVLPGTPQILLDVAHNPSSCVQLAQFLRRQDQGARKAKGSLPERRILVFAAMGDKDVAGMLRVLMPFFNTIVCTATDLSRSMPVAELAKLAKLAETCAAELSADPCDATAHSQPPNTPWRVHQAPTPAAALEVARRCADALSKDSQPAMPIVIAGSAFLIGTLRAELLALPHEALIAL